MQDKRTPPDATTPPEVAATPNPAPTPPTYGPAGTLSRAEQTRLAILQTTCVVVYVARVVTPAPGYAVGALVAFVGVVPPAEAERVPTELDAHDRAAGGATDRTDR